MKQQENWKKTEKEFEVGEWVFVKLQPYKKMSLKQKGKNKLAPNFYGPYQINENISQVVYGLNLPEKSRVHNVFHVSYLKRALGNHQSTQTMLPSLDDEGRVILEREGILPTRKRKLQRHTIREYLIKWKDLPKEEDSWETKVFFQQHPSLHMLWGQRILLRGRQFYVKIS